MDFEGYLKAKKNHKYMTSMRPVLNKRALFSDTTEDYIYPYEPDCYSELTIRFRTAKDNVDYVFFVQNGEKHLMDKIETIALFDYYEVKLQIDDEKIEYYFEIVAGRISCYFDFRGVAKEPIDFYKFVIIPGLKTPDWAKGAVMYQIYVDRFYNADKTNDVLTSEYSYIGDHVERVTNWNKYPATMGVREFYGGDLQGVIEKMDYLQELGIDVIYFNPLFVSPSNHKYDIQDYDYIDPHFGKIVEDHGELLPPGSNNNSEASKYINRVANKKNLEASNQLFADLVKEAHQRGMRVILDGVFNHCGSFNKWMDHECIYEHFKGYEKGAYISADSPYRDYFDFLNTESWPYNKSYDGWWGHDTLPKLNFEGSKSLYDYILYIGQKWVSEPYNVDGWRLDVAADLGHSAEMNHKFWKDFNCAVKEANPEAIVLAEHYGNPKEWLENGEWDTVMNYDAFMEPITWFLTGMQKHSDDYREDLYGNAYSFWVTMCRQSVAFPRSSIQMAMNELSNHDHSRFLTRTNHTVGRVNTMGPEAANFGVNKAVFREAVLMQMTWPGAPTIYYGDEAGVCGFTDPDNRRTYPWGNEDTSLIEFHRQMIRIHKQNPELLRGSIKLAVSDYNVMGYARFVKEEACLIIVNNNNYEVTQEVSVWEYGVPKTGEMERLILTSNEGFTTEVKHYEVTYGSIQVVLPKTSAIVLKYRNKKDKNFLHFG